MGALTLVIPATYDLSILLAGSRQTPETGVFDPLATDRID
jgi:hypothetical protein